MSAEHYIVARTESQWKISYHGSEQGPFSTKEEAIAAAIAAAEEAAGGGTAVEVLVQDIESNFHRAWPQPAEGGGDREHEQLTSHE